MLLFEILKRFKPSETEKQTFGDFLKTVYPSTVREALQTQEGRMGKAEIISLIQSGFVNEAIYFITKILQHSRSLQKNFLQELTQNLLNDQLPESLQKFLLIWSDKIPEDKKIGGNKLRQISRGGIDHWQERLAALAEDAINKSPDAQPHLIAYAAMLGYVEFLKSYAKQATQQFLIIVVPEWLCEQDEYGKLVLNDIEPHIGYKVDLRTGEVIEYSKGQALSDNPIFFDDTVITGNGFRKITTWWQKNSDLTLADNRLMTVTDLRAKH